jgi:hypothetical protein
MGRYDWHVAASVACCFAWLYEAGSYLAGASVQVSLGAMHDRITSTWQEGNTDRRLNE